MEHVRSGLWDVTSFLNVRLRRLSSELADVQDRTIECSECLEYAVVINSDIYTSCRFCYMTWPDKTLVMYEYTDRHEQVQMSFGDHMGLRCPNCRKKDLLVDSVQTAVECGPGFVMCFGCGSTWRNLQQCSSCSRVFESTSGHDLDRCADCTKWGTPEV